MHIDAVIAQTKGFQGRHYFFNKMGPIWYDYYFWVQIPPVPARYHSLLFFFGSPTNKPRTYIHKPQTTQYATILQQLKSIITLR